MFSSIVVIWSKPSMNTMYVLVKVSIWVVGSYKLKALKALMGFFKLCSSVCGFIVCPLNDQNKVKLEDMFYTQLIYRASGQVGAGLSARSPLRTVCASLHAYGSHCFITCALTKYHLTHFDVLSLL